MIRVSFNTTSERVAKAIQRRAPLVQKHITEELQGSLFELQRMIQRKMSGEVLKSHRGASGLLGSVRVISVKNEGGQIFGSVQAGGGPFWWLRVHEEGGRRAYDILPGAVTGKSSKRALAFAPKGSAGSMLGRSGQSRLRFPSGHARGTLRPGQYANFSKMGGVVVKSVHHLPLPQRSTLKSSLDEMRTSIIQSIYRGAAKGMKGA